MSVADNTCIRLIANCSLWVFGNPYNYNGLPQNSTNIESRIFFFVVGDGDILMVCPCVGFLQGNGTELASLIEASDSNRKYSVCFLQDHNTRPFVGFRDNDVIASF